MMDLSVTKHSAESRIPPVSGLFGSVAAHAEAACTTQVTTKQLSFSVAALLGSSRRRDDNKDTPSPPYHTTTAAAAAAALAAITPPRAEEEEAERRRRRLGGGEYEEEEEEEEDEDISVDSSDHEADLRSRDELRHRVGRLHEEDDEDLEEEEEEEEEDEEGAVSPPPSSLHHPHQGQQQQGQPLHFPHPLHHHPFFHPSGPLSGAPEGGPGSGGGAPSQKWPPGIFPPGFNCLNQALFKSGINLIIFIISKIITRVVQEKLSFINYHSQLIILLDTKYNSKI
jgi:hypothetical protein